MPPIIPPVVAPPPVLIPNPEIHLQTADATFLNGWISENNTIAANTVFVDAEQRTVSDNTPADTAALVSEVQTFIANNSAYIASLDPNSLVAQKLGADLAAENVAANLLLDGEGVNAANGVPASHITVQQALNAMNVAVADAATILTATGITAPPPVVAPTEHNPILNSLVHTWIGETNAMEQAGADIANGGGNVLALVAQISTFEHQTTLAQHLLPPSLPLTLDLKAANVAASVLLDGITNHDTAEIGAAITSLNTAAADVAKLLSPPTPPAASTPVEHHQVVEMPHFEHLWHC